ncbi:hypothetical protein ATANTOWER_010492 [Ataeniobius toweri]|uniref:Uncharacterized protein n=1 Tax=Ataeniobius toweri TaxID=208326 RepID=A0ABU7AGI2_9TELE|nr:hypothetical protein [Ataeniobius toweri]
MMELLVFTEEHSHPAEEAYFSCLDPGSPLSPDPNPGPIEPLKGAQAPGNRLAQTPYRGRDRGQVIISTS